MLPETGGILLPALSLPALPACQIASSISAMCVIAFLHFSLTLTPYMALQQNRSRPRCASLAFLTMSLLPFSAALTSLPKLLTVAAAALIS